METNATAADRSRGAKVTRFDRFVDAVVMATGIVLMTSVIVIATIVTLAISIKFFSWVTGLCV